MIGGGITGLSLGRELKRRGADFIVLEALDRPGGVIRSAEVEGRILDWGPQRIRMTPRMAELVGEMDLDDEIIEAPSDLDLFVYRDGDLHAVPSSLDGWVTSGIVSFRAKLRLLLEPFTARANPEERVSTCFRRKFGDEVYEAVVAPLYGGLYASDPADMQVGLSLLHVLEKFRVGRSFLLAAMRGSRRIEPAAACTFRPGMQALPTAMADDLGDGLRLSTPVTKLEPNGSGWRVGTVHGPLDAARVVLTTPAQVTSDLLRDVAPAAADDIGSLRYNRLAVVHLDADTELRGLGFQVSFTEPETGLRGVTFNDSMFGRENLYTAYLGGARSPGIPELDDREISALAVREFRRCTGYDATPLSVERERMPAWDVSWAAVRDLELPPGLEVAANWWSRPGLPGRLEEAVAVATRLVETARS